MKLVVEEPESDALIASIQRTSSVTSIVGEIETIRVCRRAGVAAAQVEELCERLVVLALDDEVRRLAGSIDPPTLRTLDAIHIASALSLGGDLDWLVTYDVRQAAAASAAGLQVVSPS